MKNRFILFIMYVAILATCFSIVSDKNVFAASSTKIMNANLATHGRSYTSRMDLTVNGTTKILTQSAFSQYTGKKGLFGILYSEKPVEVYCERSTKIDTKNVTKGSGLVEFSFKDATSLYIKGNNTKVFLYVFPVPYYTWTPKGSESLALPTQYTVKMKDNTYNGIILCKTPNMFFNDGWWFNQGSKDNVMWQTNLIVPLKQEYSQFEDEYNPEWVIKGQFLSAFPIIIQSTVWNPESYKVNPIKAREMKKIVNEDKFEYWNLTDYEFNNSQNTDIIKDVFYKSIDYGYQNYIPSNMNVSKVIICGLDADMARGLAKFASDGYASVNYNSKKKAFGNMITLNNDLLQTADKPRLTAVVAHETAHIIMGNCFGVGQYTNFAWFNEGFAMMFESEVQQYLGGEGEEAQPCILSSRDYKYVDNMEKYLYLKWADAKKILDKENSWENAVLGEVNGHTEYILGYNFMTFLKENYGMKVIKDYFATNGASIKKRVENCGKDITETYSQIWYKVDFDCWNSIKKLTSPNIYIDFKTWYDKKYGIK